MIRLQLSKFISKYIDDWNQNFIIQIFKIGILKWVNAGVGILIQKCINIKIDS